VQNDIPSTMLRSLLTAWFDDEVNADVDRYDRSTGISGATVWRVSQGGKTFCLKRWPTEHPAPDELAAIHGLLKHVAQAGLAIVPVPVATCDGHSYLHSDGHLWELAPWLPGEPYNRNQPSSEKRLTAMHCLAQFHLAANSYEVSKVGAPPGLQKRREILRGLCGGRLEQLRLTVGAKPASELRTLAEGMLVEVERTVGAVVTEVEQAADVPLPLQWCLRDVKSDHVLFTGERVTGLIDFGAAAIDSVAGDLARLARSLAGDDQQIWLSALDDYEASKALTTAERRAIDCYDRGGTLAAAANWLRWLFVEERSFSRHEIVQTQLRWLRDQLRAL
jgi:Ser/Thr protein kinase RdoA (MazF antagonist)